MRCIVFFCLQFGFEVKIKVLIMPVLDPSLLFPLKSIVFEIQ